MTTWTVRIPGRRAKPRAVKAEPAVAVPAEVSLVSEALTVVAIGCGWLLLQLLVLGGVSYERSQIVLYDEFRTDLAAATAPVGGIIEPGAPVSTVEIPAMNVSEVVVEGTSSSQTLHAPGHRRDTVLPGQPGTAVVYGRASTYGAPFAKLADLRKGNRISMRTGQGESVYEVSGLRRAGDPLPQPLTPGAGRLTLVGAEGEGRLAALAPAAVLYVDAELVSKPFDTGAARLPAVTVAEQPMGRDLGVLPLLTLALAALAGAVVVAAFGARPLGRARAWVLMAAPVVAITWVSTDLAMGLLPNLM